MVACRFQGNSYYSCDNTGRARRAYQQAVWLMEDSPLKDEQQELTSYSLQCKLRSNLAKVRSTYFNVVPINDFEYCFKWL